jgi:hypothetical protein
VLAVFLFGELCLVLATFLTGEPLLQTNFRNSVRTFFLVCGVCTRFKRMRLEGSQQVRRRSIDLGMHAVICSHAHSVRLLRGLRGCSSLHYPELRIMNPDFSLMHVLQFGRKRPCDQFSAMSGIG